MRCLIAVEIRRVDIEARDRACSAKLYDAPLVIRINGFAWAREGGKSHQSWSALWRRVSQPLNRAPLGPNWPFRFGGAFKEGRYHIDKQASSVCKGPLASTKINWDASAKNSSDTDTIFPPSAMLDSSLRYQLDTTPLVRLCLLPGRVISVWAYLFKEICSKAIVKKMKIRKKTAL